MTKRTRSRRTPKKEVPNLSAREWLEASISAAKADLLILEDYPDEYVVPLLKGTHQANQTMDAAQHA